MSKAETLKCRQDVCSEWLVKEPQLTKHITEKMHNKLGRMLANRICDGQMYAVVMQKAHIKTDDVSFNKDYSTFRSEIKLQPLVMCYECRFKDMDICPMHKLKIAGVRKPDDFCSYGEREGE